MVDFSLNETDQKILEEVKKLAKATEKNSRYWDEHEEEVRPMGQKVPEAEAFSYIFDMMKDRDKKEGACSPMLYQMTQSMNQGLGDGLMSIMSGQRNWALGNASLQATGTPEQQAKWGNTLLAMANTEPGCGSDSKAIETTAVLDGDEWVLNGEKIFVTTGILCQGLVVWATIDKSAGRGGIKSFVVMKGTPGFQLEKKEKKLGIRSSDTAAFVLKNCRIPRENLLGLDEEVKQKGGGGFKGLMKTFNMTRPMVSAGGIGNVNAAYDFVQEAMKKEGIEMDWEAGPFKRTGVQDKMIELESQIQAASLSTLRAAWLAEKGQPNNLESAMCKAKGGEVSRTGAQLAIELLGALGITQDQLVEKAFRDARITDIYEGTGEINRLVVARAILGYSSEDLM
ncbi:MAG: acyl-CoA dehydrogenase family protein [Proteobacteria bacterium]|nr:acyl-CoA dehydrogenase family protein [Pseudomonadota bacterium]MBU4470553.1 acyl-CoA dehydrogenase family protein [Pseudomonadota bacterium]MCG2751389.1 acyl-CoA dehydrogenase family protein [Desulfobacteraceae bacterium]